MLPITTLIHESPRCLLCFSFDTFGLSAIATILHILQITEDLLVLILLYNHPSRMF